MSVPRRQTAAMRAVLKKTDRCELCGSWRDLQVHHIIPEAFGGPDIEENLIVVCGGCHGRLTPKGLLSSMGIEKHKSSPFSELRIEFFKRLDEEMGDIEDPVKLSVADALDIFNETVDSFIRKYKCTFRKRTEDVKDSQEQRDVIATGR